MSPGPESATVLQSAVGTGRVAIDRLLDGSEPPRRGAPVPQVLRARSDAWMIWRHCMSDFKEVVLAASTALGGRGPLPQEDILGRR